MIGYLLKCSTNIIKKKILNRNSNLSWPKFRFFKNDLYQRQLYTRITYITDVVCKRTRRSVYVAAAAACKSGTLGFGDGNGCAPPGLRKPAPGLNIGVDFTWNEWPEKRGIGDEHNRVTTFEIPAPSWMVREYCKNRLLK